MYELLLSLISLQKEPALDLDNFWPIGLLKKLKNNETIQSLDKLLGYSRSTNNIN